MKKIIVIASAIAVLIISAVASFSVLIGAENEFFNENLEALTETESGTETCFKNIHTAEGRQVLYCGSCTWQPGAPDFFSGKGKC